MIPEASTALSFICPSSQVTINDCIFLNNSGNSLSNIMYINSNELRISSISAALSNYFDTSNISRIYPALIATWGAIGFVKTQLFSLVDSNFSNCFAETAGGFYFSLERNPQLSILNCRFSKIYGINKGGVFFFEVASQAAASVGILNSSFENIATILADGGVVHIYAFLNIDLTLENCSFRQLHTGGVGAVLYAFNARIAIRNIIVEDNVIPKRDPNVMSN